MRPFPPAPKFPAKSLKPEFIIHSAPTIVVLAENWLIGTGQIKSNKELNDKESPLATLREIKHQSRNAFKSKAFELTPYVLEAREALIGVQDIVAPHAGKNRDVYEHTPELYWHYGAYAYYINELEEARDVLKNHVIPAFMFNSEQILKTENLLEGIEKRLKAKHEGLPLVAPQEPLIYPEYKAS